MSEEIQQAVQIIRVAYDGIEIAMKIGSGTLEQMKQMVDFLIAIVEYEKSMGKTDMRKLLLKGGDLQVLQFAESDRKQIEKLAKKYGVLYSVLPDINRNDGMIEIIFHTEATPRVNMLAQKIGSAKIATFDDYLKNGNEEELSKVMSFLEKQGKQNPHTAEERKVGKTLDGLMEKVGMYVTEKKSVSMEEIKENFSATSEQAEEVLKQLEKIGVLDKSDNGQHKVIMDKEAFIKRITRYKELSERVAGIAAAGKRETLDITIAKQLVIEENDHAVKTRIPGTWGENVKYIWLDKKNTMDIHDGKTILTFLDAEKEYKLYTKDNRIVGTMKGKDLYSGHYDSISVETAKRYKERKRADMASHAEKKPSIPKKR